MGCDVAIMPEQLPKDEDDYYWIDLVGCTLVNESGVSLGVVKEMMETGAHDVMRVRGESGDELIPFVMDAVVKAVDIANKRIIVDWESGYFNN
jgi:16S rRNA processing protein RimM